MKTLPIALGLVCLAVLTAQAAPVNVAIYKYHLLDATPHYNNDHRAGLAIDGGYGGNGYATQNTSGGYWSLDFDGTVPIDSFKVFPRDNLYGRINGSIATFYDHTGAVVATETITGLSASQPVWTTTNTVPVYARSVKIEGPNMPTPNDFLNFGEFEAYAENVAQGKTARQSSTHSGSYPASNAVDGNLGSFNHTANGDPAPWVEVDLGGYYELDSVIAYNRRDCCGERLQNVTISVGDRYQTTAQSDVLNPGNALGSPPTLALDLHEENGGPTLARTVRVAANTSFVHLAELQAFGEATAITTAPGARLLMAGADMSLMTEGPVTLQNATARGSQTSPSLLVGQTIDGTTGSGGWGNGVDWGSGVEFKNNVAVWETASDIEDGSSSILEFIMNFSSYGDHGLGKFRLLATNADRDSFADGLANGGDVGDGVHWIVLDDLIAFSADSGLELVGDDLQADGWFLIDDTANPGSDEYGILLGNTLDGITGFRLEIADDPSLTGGGPGLSNSNGNSVLTELSVNFATIASTPEPGTVWLFALLVPAALLVRRRRLRCQS